MWSAGFTIFHDVLQFVLMLFLVRLLTPEAYGQFGLAVSIVGFLNVFSCQKFMSHALQVRDDADVHYQESFTAAAFIQIGLVVLTNAVAFTMWFSPSYRDIAPLLHVMSATFLLDWPSFLRTTMLERDLDWRRLRGLHGVGVALGAATSLVLAVAGAGVYALIAPGMVFKRVPFVYDLFVAERWRPTWTFSARAFAPALRFAFARTGSALVGTLRQLAESGVLVHVFGFALFGVYGRAVGLAHFACQKLAVVGVQGLYPVMTKVEPGTAAAGRVASLVLRAVAWGVVPTGLLLWSIAGPVVELLYGGRWLGVVPMLGSALLMSGLGAVAHAGYFLLLANGQQRRCLTLDIVGLVLTAAALTFALPHGTIPYLRAQAALHAVLLAAAVLWLVRGRTLTTAAIRAAFGVPLICGVAALLICEFLRWGLGANLQGPLVVAYAAVFVGAYLGGLSLLAAAELRELLRLAPFGQRLESAFEGK